MVGVLMGGLRGGMGLELGKIEKLAAWGAFVGIFFGFLGKARNGLDRMGEGGGEWKEGKRREEKGKGRECATVSG